MRVRVVLVLAVVLDAGCYRPSLRDCTVQCSNAGECGGDQICGGDGWCAAPATAGHCEQATTGDGEPPPPPPRNDAGDSECRAACTAGTCDHGVCVIDCSAEDACPSDVNCPGNVPCRVVCGDHSCGHHVDCRMAPVCEIECVGTGSCADELRCGTSRCTVTCSGDGACKRVRCADACACEATCSGPNSCIDPVECPQNCKAGEGCTAAGACDQC